MSWNSHNSPDYFVWQDILWVSTKPSSSTGTSGLSSFLWDGEVTQVSLLSRDSQHSLNHGPLKQQTSRLPQTKNSLMLIQWPFTSAPADSFWTCEKTVWGNDWTDNPQIDGQQHLIKRRFFRVSECNLLPESQSVVNTSLIYWQVKTPRDHSIHLSNSLGSFYSVGWLSRLS